MRREPGQNCKLMEGTRLFLLLELRSPRGGLEACEKVPFLRVSDWAAVIWE